MGGGLSRHELAAAVSEAGGLGTIAVPGAKAIERELRAARPPDFPLLLAGGIAERADVAAALEAGAAAAVAGTRFLLADESHAHPGYRARLLEGNETLLTELFGLGWLAPHRVLPNAATDR